ncbi:MAG: glycosyltransferase family 2 protein [Suilimivivens sp.]
MSQKKISVIVTAYNIEQYLPRCLDSLLKQTYEPLEIIVVDDGSTDATAAICDEYAKRAENIKVMHRENGGPSAARNTGLTAAQGDYIGYVDGDDFIEPDMYESMLMACIRTNADIAICSYRPVGEGAEEFHPTGNVIELSREQALELYISGHSQYHIYHSVWSKLFSRKVIENIAFREGRKSEDIMYTTQALAAASKCVFLDTPYYNYMVDRDTSIMNSRLHERRFQDEIPFWKEQEEYLSKLGMRELSKKASYQFYKRMLFYYLDFKDKRMKESCKDLVKMLKKEKKQIRSVYRGDFVATGDKARMKVFLISPGFYYRIVKAYEKYIIPLRQ